MKLCITCTLGWARAMGDNVLVMFMSICIFELQSVFVYNPKLLQSSNITIKGHVLNLSDKKGGY